jgi:hypothetical protein
VSDQFDTLPYRDVSDYVRDEPLTALAIAAAAGFVLGGGVNGRVGLGILTFVGRNVLRGVATSLIVGIFAGTSDNVSHDRATHGGERYDDGRTEYQESR